MHIIFQKSVDHFEISTKHVNLGYLVKLPMCRLPTFDTIWSMLISQLLTLGRGGSSCLITNSFKLVASVSSKRVHVCDFTHWE